MGTGPPVGSPPPVGAWAQPPPGYAADTTYPDPAYQPNTAWSGGAGPGFRSARMRRAGPGVVTLAPALLASVAISVGVMVLFLGNLIIALGAPNGTSGRQRLLQFLSPADLASAAALVLAVALIVLHRQLPGGASTIGPRRERVHSIALLAGGVAGVVAVGALVRGFVYLLLPHQPGAVKLGWFIAHLAAVVVGGAAAAWSLRNPSSRSRTSW